MKMKKVHAFFLGLLALLIVLYVSGTVILKQEAKKTTAILADQISTQSQGNIQITYQEVAVGPFGLFTRTMQVQEIMVHIKTLPMLSIKIPTLTINLGAHGFFEGKSPLHLQAKNILAVLSTPRLKVNPTLELAALDVTITPNGEAIPATQVTLTDLQFANLNQVLQTALLRTKPKNSKNPAQDPIYQGASALISQLDLNHVGLDVALDYQNLHTPISLQSTLYKTPSFLTTENMTLLPNLKNLPQNPDLLDVLFSAAIIHSQGSTTLDAKFSPRDLAAIHLSAPLALLDYSSLHLRAHSTNQYDIANGDSLMSGNFTWVHAGEINFMLHQTHLPPTSILNTLNVLSHINTNDPSAALENLSVSEKTQNAVLEQLNISYTDAGLIPKVLTLAARFEGTTPQNLQTSIALGASMLESQFRDQGLPSIAQAIQTCALYLKNPHTLTLSFAPNPLITQGEMRATLKNLSDIQQAADQNALKDNATEGDQQSAEKLNQALYNQGVEKLLTRMGFSVTLSS